MMLVSTILLICSTMVCAADIKVEPTVDYENSTIKVKLTTEAKYNQALSVVLYDGNEMGSDLSKIIKIADTIADEDGKAYVEMKLSDDIPSGEYVVSVYGGGSISNKGSKVIGYKNKNDLDDIIQDINEASLSTIKTEIEKYSEMFELPDNDEVYGQFILLRRDDFNSAFASVNEIVQGLENAKLIYEINTIVSEPDILNYLKENADKLGIDVTDTDFVSAEEGFAKTFINLKKAKALTGYKSFETMYTESLAIAVINKTDAKTMTSVIKKYADVIGISSSDYDSKCSRFNATQINKAFHGKEFKNCSEIVEAYNKRIMELSNSGNTNTGSPGGGGGGGGGGGSAPSKPSSVVLVDTDASDKEQAFTDFSDLSDAAWAEAPIKKLAGKGIVNGYEDKTFKPNNKVTREEFVTIIVRAFNVYKEDAKCKFKDISDSDWSYKYVASAAEKKYISGFENGTFGKGSFITRQDAATILYRVGLSKNKQFITEEVEFTDGENIADYSKEAIAGLKNAGVINGFEDGSFKPGDSLTRAQAVKMIEILLDL